MITDQKTINFLVHIGAEGQKDLKTQERLNLHRSEPCNNIYITFKFNVSMLQKHKPVYLLDEGSLSKKSGMKIKDAIRVFDLKGLGIDQERFIKDVTPTFKKLTWDMYDVRREQIDFLLKYVPDQKNRLKKFFPSYYSGKKKLSAIADIVNKLSSKKKKEFLKLKPYRRRSISKFILTLSKTGWHIKKVKHTRFYQKVKDYRSIKRVLPETSPSITRHPEFRKILIALANIVKELHPRTKKISMEVHQTGVVASCFQSGDNSPEGIHLDGFDYDVTALVVERKGIRGGVSMVYGSDKKRVYLKKTLQPGQGIFQNDLWHDVTKIHVKSGYNTGLRNIFGFDINIEK